MSEQIKYGFGTDVVGGRDVDFIMTGDGYTQFHDIYFDNCVGLGIAYGEGNGELNNLVVFDELRDIDDIDSLGFIIKFTKPESIDSLISQLYRCKLILNNKHKISTHEELKALIDKSVTFGELKMPEVQK